LPKTFKKPKKVKISTPIIFGFDLDNVLAHPTMKRHIFKMFQFYKTCTVIRVDKFQINSSIQQELSNNIGKSKKTQIRIENAIKKNAKKYIITGRKTRFKKTTLEWLKKHNISYNGIFFFEGKIKSVNSLANHKAKLIKKLKIKIFWEDTKLIAWMLAFKCPNCEIRLFDKENYCFTTINVKDKVFTPTCGCGCGEKLDLDKPLREIRRIGFINGHKQPEYMPKKPLGKELEPKKPSKKIDNHEK